MNKKQSLRKMADELWVRCCVKKWGQICESCGKQGVQVHHFFPKGSYNYLRYLLDNGIIICQGCHFRHHFVFDPTIQQRIIAKRGKKWYNKLLKKSKEKHASFKTIKYYQDVIKELEEYLKRS